MPPEYAVRFRLTFRKIGTFHCREWCSVQRIRITMIAGGNHSIISMNASPTVFFQRFRNRLPNTNLPLGVGLLLLLEHIGAHAAEGALVILGQLVALVDIAADGAYKLLHDNSS